MSFKRQVKRTRQRDIEKKFKGQWYNPTFLGFLNAAHEALDGEDLAYVVDGAYTRFICLRGLTNLQLNAVKKRAFIVLDNTATGLHDCWLSLTPPLSEVLDFKEKLLAELAELAAATTATENIPQIEADVPVDVDKVSA